MDDKKNDRKDELDQFWDIKKLIPQKVNDSTGKQADRFATYFERAKSASASGLC